MPKFETRVFKVGDGNFIIKIAGKDMVILDAGAHAGGNGNSKSTLASALELGSLKSVVRGLLPSIENVHTIVSHQHKDHISLLDNIFKDIKNSAPSARINPILVGGARPNKNGTKRAKRQQNIGLTLPDIAKTLGKPVEAHFWGNDGEEIKRKVYEYPAPGLDGKAIDTVPAVKKVETEKDLSFKIGDRLEQMFDPVTRKATIGGETFFKGNNKSAFGDGVSLGRERISILTPRKYQTDKLNTDKHDNNSVNAKSLVTISQFRGIKQVFPGDATGDELDAIKKTYPNAFYGSDMFITPHHNSRGANGQALVMGKLATEEGTNEMPPSIAILSTDRTPENSKQDEENNVRFQKAYEPSMFQVDKYKYNSNTTDLLASKAQLNPRADVSTAIPWTGHRELVTLTTQKLPAGGRFLIGVQDDGKLGVDIGGVGPVNPISLAGKFTPGMLSEIMDKARYSKKTSALVGAFSPTRVNQAFNTPEPLFFQKDTWIPNDVETKAAAQKIINEYFAEKQNTENEFKRNGYDLSAIKFKSRHYVSSSMPTDSTDSTGKKDLINGLFSSTKKDLYRVLRREQNGYKTTTENLGKVTKIISMDPFFREGIKQTNGITDEAYLNEAKKQNFTLGDFQLNKERIISVPLKKERIISVPCQLLNLANPLKRKYSANGTTDDDYLINKKRIISVPFDYSLNTGNNSIIYPLFLKIKALKKQKKYAQQQLLNLANPLIDPYIKRATVAPITSQTSAVKHRPPGR